MSKLFSQIAAAVIALMLCSAISAQQSKTESRQNKVSKLLDESKQPFTKADQNIWTVPFNGKNIDKFQMEDMRNE